MNYEIRCITNKRKTTKNEWETDDSEIFRALYSVYKKIRTILFQYLLVNFLIKHGCFSSVKIYNI